ncbi:unnamed protein product, partial [Discosporangium mesarthrocarpum]
MLFQCEPGSREGFVRFRSRATNTFLFFLGIRPPLTWVAWDRDVMGGDWEDVKLVWLAMGGVEGGEAEEDRARVAFRSRTKGFVSWNGLRFTHTRNKESATVFLLQRMAAVHKGGGGGGGRCHGGVGGGGGGGGS